MKINQIIHEAGTGLEIDRSIPGRTIARISGDLAHRTGPLTDKKLPDHHPDDDYIPWSGKVGASTRDDEEDTFDIDYTGDDGELKEFVQQAPVAVPADDAPPAQGYAIKVHGPFGARQGGIAAATLWYALSAVFPDRYPSKDYQNYGAQLDSPQSRVLNQIHRTGSAVVADGIAGLDLAETLANKLAMFKPEDQYLRPLGSKHVEVVESGLDEDAPRPPVAPDPQNYDSDVDYYNDLDADPTLPDTDADYENMIDDESNDWFDESRKKVGNMDADAFDAALSRMKKLAGAGPLKTVYDPNKRVYKNVPHAVQPAQQPKKAR
jgi:hypothetical protein